jgi:uncharacterized protein YndB with AHSA1/START domain
MNKSITVQTTINAPLEHVWKLYTEPKHITQWNNASKDWHTPRAVNDLRAGGKFLFRMEARDGSQGFDFNGTYTQIKTNQLITYTIGDGRTVRVQFTEQDERTNVLVTFEPEGINPLEMQRDGWQAILNNFKRYVEQA